MLLNIKKYIKYLYSCSYTELMYLSVFFAAQEPNAVCRLFLQLQHETKELVQSALCKSRVILLSICRKSFLFSNTSVQDFCQLLLKSKRYRYPLHRRSIRPHITGRIGKTSYSQVLRRRPHVRFGQGIGNL